MKVGSGSLVLCGLLIASVAGQAQAQTPLAQNERDEYRQRIKQLEDRLALVEDTLQTLLRDRAPALPIAAISAASPARAALVEAAKISGPVTSRREVMPPELVPEIGKIGAEVGIIVNGSSSPYGLNNGKEVTGFIDLPLFDRPSWINGKLSYEISIGLSRSKTSFNTTSNVAQVANLAILNTLIPNGGAQNILDAVTGTGTAPFPVTARTETTLKLLEVVPFSFKYTTTLLDRWRIRPYALLGFGTYVTIHRQAQSNTGVRLDANLPASVVALINSVYGGTAPFGGPLVAGQIAQSRELEAHGLPSGHGNFDLGWVTGGGFEMRLTRSFSLGFDSRRHRIAGAPGALTTYGTRFGFHF